MLKTNIEINKLAVIFLCNIRIFIKRSMYELLKLWMIKTNLVECQMSVALNC